MTNILKNIVRFFIRDFQKDLDNFILKHHLIGSVDANASFKFHSFPEPSPVVMICLCGEELFLVFRQIFYLAYRKAKIPFCDEDIMHSRPYWWHEFRRISPKSNLISSVEI